MDFRFSRNKRLTRAHWDESLARVLKFWIPQVQIWYYLSSEQKRCWLDCMDAQSITHVFSWCDSIRWTCHGKNVKKNFSIFTFQIFCLPHFSCWETEHPVISDCFKSSYMSHFMIKPVSVRCEQQRRRSACASTQSDKRLCCSLPG